jgi:hypothetical protein
MATAPDEKKKLQMTTYQNALGPEGKGAQVTTCSLVPPAGFTIGSSPDELYAGLLLHQKGLTTFQDVLSREPVTLGGRPGLKVFMKANNVGTPPRIPDDPEAEQRIAEGLRKDAARRRTYFVTTTPTRVIVIIAQTEGDPDPAERR